MQRSELRYCIVLVTHPSHATDPPNMAAEEHPKQHMTKRTRGIDGDQTADAVRREALDGVVHREVLVDGVVDLDVARLLPRVPGRQGFLDGRGEGSAWACGNGADAADGARLQCGCTGRRDGYDPTGSHRGGAGRPGQGAAEDSGGCATGEHG